MRKTRHVTPLDSGLTDTNIDLTAVATTEYEPTSGFIDVREYFIYTAVINVNETTTTTGAFTFRIDVLEKDKSTVLWTIDLVTGITTATAGRHVVTFGAGTTAQAISASGTLSTDADVLKVAEFINPVIEITTQSDGDATANVHLLLEG